MYSRYSFRVVAPMTLSFPLASIGFSRFAASIPPPESERPAMIRWISSPSSVSGCSRVNMRYSPIKRMICTPSSPDFSTSPRTALTRSSYSPLYFAPAISAPMSRVSSLLSKLAGTSRSTIRCARPSTIAVLPTPGSPMSTGLPLVRRERTRMTRRISLSRPTTGSILPCSARAVRSVQS